MNSNQVATLQILYSENPTPASNRFVEVRRWETADGEMSELIVEHGQLDPSGDLITECQIMPFHLSLQELLSFVD